MRIITSVFYLAFAVLAVAEPVSARTLSGAYLAAQQADARLDYEVAADYYARALRYDRENPVLFDRAMRAEIGQGDVAAAIRLADRYPGNVLNPLVSMLEITSALEDGRFTDASARLDGAGDAVLPILSDLWRGWLSLNMGEEDAAFAFWAGMNDNRTTRLFARYHAGLANIALEQYQQAAAELLDHPDAPLILNRDATRTRAELAARLDRRAEAVASLNLVLNGTLGDEGFEALRDSIAAGEDVGFSALEMPTQGFARALYDVASVFGEDNDEVALIYTRLATHLDPELWEAWLLAAEILERQGQYDLADEAYAQIPTTVPQAVDAGLGRASVLIAAERTDDALTVYARLAAEYPESLRVHYYYGEDLRRAERFDEAIIAFDRAEELALARDSVFWQLYNARAIAYHLSETWPPAEADFRTALDLAPEQPFVLNYLGYSLVEQGRNLEEALDMIERAAAQRPSNGFIVDSLGWVYFILQRYDEAVEPLERAVALEPIDPVINDHLGDAYWMVGREREAEFQWNRALSFDPEPEDRTRILRKLEVGLDAVRLEEGYVPLQEARNVD
ncbi:MAG: tetratricopeptide repeat protein [Pseudomonadota bacterium]